MPRKKSVTQNPEPEQDFVMPVLPKTRAVIDPKELATWWPRFSLIGENFDDYQEILTNCTSQRGVAASKASTFTELLYDLRITECVTNMSAWKHHYPWDKLYVRGDNPTIGYRLYNGQFRKFDISGLINPPINMGVHDDTEAVKSMFQDGTLRVMYHVSERDKSFELWPVLDLTGPWEHASLKDDHVRPTEARRSVLDILLTPFNENKALWTLKHI